MGLGFPWCHKWERREQNLGQNSKNFIESRRVWVGRTLETIPYPRPLQAPSNLDTFFQGGVVPVLHTVLFHRVGLHPVLQEFSVLRPWHSHIPWLFWHGRDVCACFSCCAPWSFP